MPWKAFYTHIKHYFTDTSLRDYGCIKIFSPLPTSTKGNLEFDNTPNPDSNAHNKWKSASIILHLWDSCVPVQEIFWRTNSVTDRYRSDQVLEWATTEMVAALPLALSDFRSFLWTRLCSWPVTSYLRPSARCLNGYRVSLYIPIPLPHFKPSIPQPTIHPRLSKLKASPSCQWGIHLYTLLPFPPDALPQPLWKTV